MEKQMSKEAAVEFFGAFFLGEHHIPGEVKPWGLGWCVSCPGTLATFDFDGLTRLVFLAHDRCVRAEVMSGGPNRGAHRDLATAGARRADVRAPPDD